MADSADDLTVSPIDRDLWIRTVIGEAAGDPSAAAVAHVIANRARNGGMSPSQVVLQPSQFEPWQTRARELMSYAPDSKAYQSAAQVVDGVIAGKIADPTGGATHFYAPAAQAALGRPAPKWDDGTGMQIGAHKFFGGKQVAQNSTPDLLGSWGSGPAGKGALAAPAQDVAPDLLGQWQPPTAQWSPAPAAANAAPVPNVSGMKPGTEQDGLVWDESGGHDPKTGALVIAGKPFTKLPSSPVVAALHSTLEGVPIIGPALAAAPVKAAAAANALTTNTPMDQNLGAFRGIVDASQAAHPNITTAGNIAGGVIGTAAGMVAAPALFGVDAAAPLAVNALASSVTGAGIGGADALARGGSLEDAKRSGMIGGAFGLAGPVIGKGIGYGVNGLWNAASRTTPAARNVADVLSEIGMAPQDARAALTRMGPNAVLADIDPALTTEAAGLARQGGAPTSILKGAMAARAGQADNRVATAIESTLGPRPDITAAKDAVYASAQNAASPYYDAARASAKPMDVTPVLSDIDQQLKNAVGGEATVLNKIKGYLTSEKVGVPGPDGKPVSMVVPKDDPSALLKARQAIDGDIESLARNGTIDGTSAGKSALRAATDARAKLDSILKTDNNIAAGDKEFSTHMALKDAMDEGADLFKSGTRVQDFQRSLASKSPQEVQAMQHGALSALWESLDNARRGALSGAQSMFGKSSANRAKLDALFPGAGDVFDMLHGEAAMRATEQRVAQNSVTAEAQAIAKKYSPQSSPVMDAAAPILGQAVGGGVGAGVATGGRMLYSSLRDAMTRNALARLSEGTARGLAATGPEQSAFLDAVQRAHATNALARGSSGAAGAAANLLTRSVGQNALQPLLQ